MNEISLTDTCLRVLAISLVLSGDFVIKHDFLLNKQILLISVAYPYIIATSHSRLLMYLDTANSLMTTRKC